MNLKHPHPQLNSTFHSLPLPRGLTKCKFSFLSLEFKLNFHSFHSPQMSPLSLGPFVGKEGDKVSLLTFWHFHSYFHVTCLVLFSFSEKCKPITCLLNDTCYFCGEISSPGLNYRSFRVNQTGRQLIFLASLIFGVCPPAVK